MLRKDFQRVEILEQEVGDVREEIKTVKVWGKVIGTFLTIFISIVSFLGRLKL